MPESTPRRVSAFRRFLANESSAGIVLIAVAALALIVLTAVFDSVMIGAGLFTYAETLISGIRVGLAQINTVVVTAAKYMPLPAARPIDATAHRPAAVVSPA